MQIEPWSFWLLLSLFMVVVEMITVGFFAITIAGGALLAMIISLITSMLWVQILVFLLGSVLCFFTVKPFLQRLFPVKNEIKTVVDRLQGKKALVITEICNIEGRGQIKVDGEIWSARSQHDHLTIQKGEQVEILRIEGVKAIVKLQGLE